ncbi:hypothetical protein ALNOE001_05820 [Candidatus Methanobinarius endosymbioticus]|uniref:Uncharacterized protein n=1 Tax=Candidatus Methanobinarius endosymbioticus TaxID=2006182 RepID=A0A366MEL7_9EURY|nr:hypothetical protein ALNOE001_05820 [Candidatus Methanobinarius endosymbioticus]
MVSSKKPSNEESILGIIASSIKEIEKIDAENESKNNIDEDEKNSEENNVDDKFSISSKADELLSDDSKRKFPILPIIGSIIGVLLSLLGIFLMLGTSNRVVDSVASGEIGTISIFVIFLGIVILGLSIFKILSKKRPISEAFDNLNNLKLLDEDEDDEKNENNQDEEHLKTDPDLFNMKKKDSSSNMDNKDNLDDIDNKKEDINESSTIDSLEEIDSSVTDYTNFLEDISDNTENIEDMDSKEENFSEDTLDDDEYNGSDSNESKENIENNSLNKKQPIINESNYEESLDSFIKDEDSYS